MTNKSKARGTATESAVVTYLRASGFASAERSALHGGLDQGDITGTPGAAWEVKGGAAAEQASDAQIAAWLAETEVERVNRRADVGLLVTKRRGKGNASVGAWWVHLPGWTYIFLAAPLWGVDSEADDHKRKFADKPPVRMTLLDAVLLLRSAGYGSPLSSEGDAA